MPRTPHAIDQTVGARVRARREALGFNQSDLGRALGLTFQQVQKYEKGSNRISCSKLIGISDFLECSPMTFLAGLARADGGTGAIETPPATSPQERRLMSKISLLSPATIGAMADLASSLADTHPQATA